MTEREEFAWFGHWPGRDYEAQCRSCRRCESSNGIAGYFRKEEDLSRRYVCWSCVEHEVPLTEVLARLVP